jgi:flagellar FliJ protein
MSGKKFQFRLETVLKLRRLEAERAKTQLATALRAIVECRQKIRQSEEELDTMLSRALEGKVVQDLRRFAEARSAAIDAVETFKNDLEGLVAAETEARNALAVKMTDQKALEDLRERQAEAFYEEGARQEQLRLDEFAVIGHGRRQSPHLFS